MYDNMFITNVYRFSSLLASKGNCIVSLKPGKKRNATLNVKFNEQSTESHNFTLLSSTGMWQIFPGQCEIK